MNSYVLCHDWEKGSIKIPCQALTIRPVDLAFADPPYNIGVEYADDRTRDRRSHVEYANFVARVLSQLRSVMRPGGVLWWMAPAEQVDWLPRMLSELFGPRLHSVIWYETFSQYQQGTLTRDWRLLLCHRTHATGPVTFNPDAIRIESVRQKMGDKRADPRGRVPGCVWQMRRLQGNAREHVDWHPNQVPPELLERIILGWSNQRDVVMDAFAGSGSMGLQCSKHGRSFVGVDKSPTYCRKMKERIDESLAS